MLTHQELVDEVEALQHQGHRRLLLLTGEHPKVCTQQFSFFHTK
jgi:2-iminoacetate synthase ThiH